jgi:uncharacterized membrane protein YeaQ/YmgE (transglycosylase-associated protein family)
MSVGQLIVYLVVALLCGLVGQMLAGRSVGGFIVSTVVGLIGALLGGYIAQEIGAPEPFPVHVGGKEIPIIWAIIGAALVTLVVSVVQRGWPPRRRAAPQP